MGNPNEHALDLQGSNLMEETMIEFRSKRTTRTTLTNNTRSNERKHDRKIKHSIERTETRSKKQTRENGSTGWKCGEEWINQRREIKVKWVKRRSDGKTINEWCRIDENGIVKQQ